MRAPSTLPDRSVTRCAVPSPRYPSRTSSNVVTVSPLRTVTRGTSTLRMSTTNGSASAAGIRLGVSLGMTVTSTSSAVSEPMSSRPRASRTGVQSSRALRTSTMRSGSA
jgi:hypothetical protein